MEAAARLLRTHGYEATTLRMIASEVGIKAGSVYYYFDSKEKIVETVVNDGIAIVQSHVLDALKSCPADATPKERLRVAIKAHLFSYLEYSNFTSSSVKTFTYLPESIRKSNIVFRREYEGVWRKLIGEIEDASLIPQGVSSKSVVLMLIGAMNSAGEWYNPEKMSIDKIADEFATIVVRA
nr:TetR/AcrR family transcriptional regulator [Rhizobium sp. ARZ01]